MPEQEVVGNVSIVLIRRNHKIIDEVTFVRCIPPNLGPFVPLGKYRLYLIRCSGSFSSK